MAQTNYTPISLYYSATATNVPTAGNLVAGELALNTADGKLFYKDSAGVVQVLATKGGVGSSSTTQVLYNSSGLVVGSAGLTFDGTNLATTGTATATRFIPSGSTIATNGLYLPAANNLGFSTNSTEAMRIDSSGNVGIGTSSPTAKLYVSAPSGTAPLTLDTAGGSDTTRALNFNVIGDNYGKILVPSGSGGAMAFWTGAANAASERMRIDSSGNLLVNGTTVRNSAKVSIDYNGSTNGGMGVNDTASANGSSLIAFLTGGTFRGGITNNNNTGVLYNVTSDYRLKTVIGSISDSGQRIDSLEPIEYEWNEGGRTKGFLAHKFAEVYPNSVVGEKDAIDEEGKPVYQGMQASTPEVMADLIAEIQSLRKRVAQLESK